MSNQMLELAKEDKLVKIDPEAYQGLLSIFLVKMLEAHGDDFVLHIQDLLEYDASEYSIEVSTAILGTRLRLNRKKKKQPIMLFVSELEPDTEEVVKAASKLIYIDVKDFSHYVLKEIQDRFPGQLMLMVSKVEGYTWTDRIGKIITAYLNWKAKSEIPGT